LFIGGIVLIITFGFEGKRGPVFLCAGILIVEVGGMDEERSGVRGVQLGKSLRPIKTLLKGILELVLTDLLSGIATRHIGVMLDLLIAAAGLCSAGSRRRFKWCPLRDWSFICCCGGEAGTSSTSSPSETEVEESGEATSKLPTHSSNQSAKGAVSPSMSSGSRTFSRPVWTSLFKVGPSKSS